MSESPPVPRLSEWLGSRTPPPPDPFQRWLAFAEADGAGRADEEGLTELGHAAMDRALSRPGRVRESAFELLAAGAYYTYACEFATEGGDVAAKLTQLTEELGTRFPQAYLPAEETESDGRP